MLREASPASRKPALRPIRGSVESSTQPEATPQFTSPGLHSQAPPLQIASVGHTFPQVPQSFTSVVVSTHEPEQISGVPAGQAVISFRHDSSQPGRRLALLTGGGERARLKPRAFARWRDGMYLQVNGLGLIRTCRHKQLPDGRDIVLADDIESPEVLPGADSHFATCIATDEKRGLVAMGTFDGAIVLESVDAHRSTEVVALGVGRACSGGGDEDRVRFDALHDHLHIELAARRRQTLQHRE